MLGSFPVWPERCGREPRLESALGLSVAGLRQINPAETVLFSRMAAKARRCGEITRVASIPTGGAAQLVGVAADRHHTDSRRWFPSAGKTLVQTIATATTSCTSTWPCSKPRSSTYANASKRPPSVSARSKNACSRPKANSRKPFRRTRSSPTPCARRASTSPRSAKRSTS